MGLALGTRAAVAGLALRSGLPGALGALLMGFLLGDSFVLGLDLREPLPGLRGSGVLGLQGVDGAIWIEHLLSGLPGGQVGFLIVVNVFVFFLAFFLDFFEIAFIIVPLLAPVALKLGIDLVWFGVLLGINMQTSFMHPPFGFALFYLKSVAPREVRTSDIYWGALPFVVIQLFMVAAVLAFANLVGVAAVKIDASPVEIKLDVPSYLPPQ